LTASVDDVVARIDKAELVRLVLDIRNIDSAGPKRRWGVYCRMIRILAVSIFAMMTALASSIPTNAQSYPSKPIRIIVGYPPGAGIDFTARLFAERLKTVLGQPVLVENKAGAGGELAAEYVSRSDPDGYTLMYAVGSDLVWTKFLTKRPTADPLKDLTPIATAISSVNCVAINAAVPIKSNSPELTLASSPMARLEFSRTII
jgi:tripartite-type tricarboxylate transporter receptor subunit TctC